MKNLMIIANWKANKTQDEAIEWLEEIKVESTKEKTVVLCPPTTLLALLAEQIIKISLPISLGAQDFPMFKKGPYTGEEPAMLLASFVGYAIIGHSERRTNFNETDDVLSKKVKNAIECGVQPIFCVQGPKTDIPEGVKIVAYEPISAIGTGDPDTPQNANTTALLLKKMRPGITVCYGGSVNAKNVRQFTDQPDIDGVLVGGASLDPIEFSAIIENA